MWVGLLVVQWNNTKVTIDWFRAIIDQKSHVELDFCIKFDFYFCNGEEILDRAINSVKVYTSLNKQIRVIKQFFVPQSGSKHKKDKHGCFDIIIVSTYGSVTCILRGIYLIEYLNKEDAGLRRDSYNSNIYKQVYSSIK